MAVVDMQSDADCKIEGQVENNERTSPNEANSPCGATGPVPWKQVAFYLLIATAALLHKKLDALSNPQFWAEDGAVLFSDARTLGFKSIVKPIAGSRYVYQRFIAYTGNGIKARYVPAYYNYVAFLTTLAVLVYIMRSQTDFRWKGLFAVAVVASPHIGEVFLSLSNIHWIMAIGLLALILSKDPRRAIHRLIECASVVVLCLSGPFGILFWPLFAIRFVRRKSSYSGLMLGLASLCAFLQLMVLNSDRIPGHLQISDPNWIGFFGNRLAGLWFVGDLEFLKEIPNDVSLFALGCSFVFAMAVLAFYHRDYDCLCLLCAAGAIVLATAYSFRGSPGTYGLAPIGDRYAFIPSVIVVWMLLRMIHWSNRLFFPGCLLLALAALSSASLPRCPKLPDYHWAEASQGVDGPTACEVPINPAPWRVYYYPGRHFPH